MVTLLLVAVTVIYLNKTSQQQKLHKLYKHASASSLQHEWSEHGPTRELQSAKSLLWQPDPMINTRLFVCSDAAGVVWRMVVADIAAVAEVVVAIANAHVEERRL